MRLAEQLGHLRRHSTRHRPIAELQHVHTGAQFGGDRGEFQADEAGADHHHVAYLLHQGGEGIGILLGLDAKYALQLGTGYWQRTVVCAGG
ncbi:hypothetical protein D9M71_402690 [compost metagenome]